MASKSTKKFSFTVKKVKAPKVSKASFAKPKKMSLPKFKTPKYTQPKIRRSTGKRLAA